MNHYLVALLGCVLATGVGCATGAGPTAPPAAQANASRIEKPAEVSHAEKARARSHQSVGVSYLRDGNVALAIRELRSAAKLDPADKWIQLALAEAYRRRGLFDDAERHLLTALVIDPESQESRLTLSALYIQLERYEESIVHADWLIDEPTFPRPWLALTNKGFAEIKLERPKAARESLELAIQYHDRYWRAILNLAILDAEEGKKLDAIEGLEDVVALKPGPMPIAEASFRLAEIYVSFGNREGAIQHFEVAALQRPSGTWGKRSEDYLKRLR